jgi:hypothetical protein
MSPWTGQVSWAPSHQDFAVGAKTIVDIACLMLIHRLGAKKTTGLSGLAEK